MTFSIKNMATHVSRILKVQPLCVFLGRAVHIGTKEHAAKHFPLVVLGGGAGGCSVAARSCRMLGSGNVAVVEPAKVSIYLYLPVCLSIYIPVCLSVCLSIYSHTFLNGHLY